MAPPERRAALATSATCLLMTILDFELRMWGDTRRVLLLGVGTVIAGLCFAVFRKNPGAVIVLGSVVGLFIASLELAFEKHVWPSWAIAAGLAWPLSLALVVASARVAAKPGSILHALSASLPWLIPATLSVWIGSAIVALCVEHHPAPGLRGAVAHFELHLQSIGLVVLGCVLAAAQLGRSAAGLRLRARRRDLGLGVVEERGKAPMSAYRTGPMAVAASPEGGRAVIVHGIVALSVIALDALAIAPVTIGERPMCVCSGPISDRARDREAHTWVARGDACVEAYCSLYSPAERIHVTGPPPAGAKGTFEVKGREALAHKPILVLEDVNAWSGSYEGLPAVTVYEDGLLIGARFKKGSVPDNGEIVQGRVSDPVGLSASIAKSLEHLAPTITLSSATDQPEVTIFARSNDAWRAVTVVGFRGEEPVDFPTDHAPEAFVAAWRTVASLLAAATEPFPREDYVVELHDPSGDDVDTWPKGVPAPPSGLVPDNRFVARPRVYDLHGEIGAKLRAFRRARVGARTRLPSGEDVDLWVRTTIPAGAYIEKLRYCTTSSTEPFHICDIRLPGRD